MQNPPSKSTYSKSKYINLDLKLIVWFVFVTVFSIIIRYALFPVASSDLQSFLVKTVENLKNSGKIDIQNIELMDVNFAYIYLVSTFHYFTDQIILAVKFLNTIFDVLLALGVWAIIKNYTGNKIKAISAYSITLFIPSILLIGGMWGKPDTIVATLLVWMLYSILKNRVLMSVVFFSFAISIKWWAIFLFPLLLIWILTSKIKNIYTIVLIPLIFIMFVIPLSLQGESMTEMVDIYNTQTTKTPAINNNIPNFNTLLKSGNTYNSTFDNISRTDKDNRLFSLLNRFSNFFAVIIVSFLGWLVWVLKPDWNWVQTIRFGLFSCILLTFLLPNVNSNYFIISSILALIYGFIVPSKYWYFILLEFIGLTLIVSDFLSVSLFVDRSFLIFGMLYLLTSVGFEIVKDFEEFKTLREKVALLSSKYLAKNK